MHTKLQVFHYKGVKYSPIKNGLPEILLGFKLKMLNPTLLNIHRIGEGFVKNLIWFIFTLGKFRILYLMDDKQVVHYTYIIPKVFRFPFMTNDDIQVGPCYTHPAYQKRGIYTTVLRLINDVYGNSKRTIWIYTTLKNHASQKAIERSGFVFFSYATMSSWTKILKIKPSDND